VNRDCKLCVTKEVGSKVDDSDAHADLMLRKCDVPFRDDSNIQLLLKMRKEDGSDSPNNTYPCCHRRMIPLPPDKGYRFGRVTLRVCSLDNS
jgi:hypothetical protein